MTRLTPAQIEEFEATFRYFDRDEENKLGLPEFSAALASLGIVYSVSICMDLHTLQNLYSCSLTSFLFVPPV